MPIKGPCYLKRTSSDQADAMILSFNHRWYDLLSAGKIDVVFRKRGPQGFTPKLMYAYIATPMSAIAFRMAIKSYELMSVPNALTFTNRGCIESGELRRYAGTASELIVMTISQIFIATVPLTISFLSREYNFWPSATFVPVSHTGVTKLDEVGRFRLITSTA